MYFSVSTTIKHCFHLMRSELNRFRLGNRLERVTDTVRTTVAGTYKRKNGRKETYTYDGVYGATTAGIWWFVKVLSNGQFKGTPTGMSGKEKWPTIKSVTALIEEQIENLDQISE
jgi:hypothetical protein